MVVLAAVEIALRSADGIAAARGTPLPQWFSGLPFYYWWSWSLGAAVAQAKIEGRMSGLGRLSPGLCAALGMACALLKPAYPFTFPLFGLAAASFFARAPGGPGSMRPAGWIGRHLASLGTVSYSFYLLHQPLVLMFAMLLVKGSAMPPLLAYAACLASYPLIFMVAAAFFRAVETPSTRLGRRLAAWRGAASAESHELAAVSSRRT
jgi:peptidoglycan/LPS O-acetylase OafA/YrhL